MTVLYRTLTQELGLTDRDIMRELSPSNAIIVRAIGLPSLMILMEKFAGKPVYIPGDVREFNQITQVIGIEAAEKLQDAVGGDQHITIANNFGIRTLIRLMGYKMIREGCSNSEIIDELGITRSTVKVWKKHVAPGDARPSKTISQQGKAINIAMTYLTARRATAA